MRNLKNHLILFYIVVILYPGRRELYSKLRRNKEKNFERRDYEVSSL